MNILKKIKRWIDESEIEGVMEYKLYKVIVTLVNGEVIEGYSNKYHAINCSYSKYLSIDLDKGLMLHGKLYPQHMIKHIEDEVVDIQLVCEKSFAYGIGGLTLEEIKQNQKDYKRIIEKYKKMR